MLSLKALAALLVVISANRFVLGRLSNSTVSLSTSVVFFINAVFLVVLINWFLSLSSVESSTDTSLFNQVLDLHSLAVRIRNSVVIVSLFYLTYGAYREYITSRKKPFLVLTILLLSMSILFAAGVMIAGAFIL
ncbi:hypothetical protein [uncultured Pontibacter sp.]|uniref:hypothetical protein n=1 Tax=uncultured Pontibacter sp. TaxID=453356 RepID=UPI00263979A1|nr:hypothetical protein [uncultured Pontibacter sp.]